ncbi:MAG: NADH-quinone oxidoreductase subunit J, partial [Rhodospirillaceae bacterium]
VLIGAEFLAMILVVVYVGAVAVLFLFVVMMLDINFAELREGFLQYLPIGGLIGLILAAELILIFGTWIVAPDAGQTLIAMIGALVLTLRHRPGVRRQKISDQVSRRREDVVEVRDISTGSGA